MNTHPRAPRAVAVAVAADAAVRDVHLVAPVHRAPSVGQVDDLLAQAASGCRRARLGALEPVEVGGGEREGSVGAMWQLHTRRPTTAGAGALVGALVVRSPPPQRPALLAAAEFPSSTPLELLLGGARLRAWFEVLEDGAGGGSATDANEDVHRPTLDGGLRAA